jgi:hypothetical protein
MRHTQGYCKLMYVGIVLWNSVLDHLRPDMMYIENPAGKCSK